MAESKKSRAKPLPDVARPGKSKPAGTSKPIIVTNRPILKDPMVVEEPDKDADRIVVKTGKSTIEPLSAPELKDAAKPKADDKGAGKADPKPKAGHKETIAELAAVAAAEAKEAGPAAAAEPEPPAADEAEAEAAEPAEPAEQVEPAKTDDSAETAEAADTEDEPAEPEADKPAEETAESETDEKKAAKAPKEAEVEAAAAKQHAETIESLVDSKQYFLPINSVERRRSKRVVALGVILSLVLALAWLDIALDANLIHLGGVKALTHFFST